MDPNVTNLSMSNMIQMYNACGQNEYVDLSNPNNPQCVSCTNNTSGIYDDMCSSDSNIWLPAQVEANF